MNYIKKYFIQRRNLQVSTLSLTRKYPKSLNNIGIISRSDFMPDTNFITKLKIGFGGKVQIFTFVLDERSRRGNDFYKIGLSDFSFFGEFKNDQMSNNLKDLDVLIDMTLTKSFLKSIVLNYSSKAYKICLGNSISDHYNLCVNLNTLDQDLFADEIIKYHNILGNG